MRQQILIAFSLAGMDIIVAWHKAVRQANINAGDEGIGCA